MPKEYLVPIDLNQQEIQNAVVQQLGSDPGSPVNAQIWVNTATHTLSIRLNGVTITLGRLDQISLPTANLNLNGNRYTNAADGVANSDLATVGQVAAAQNGMTWKDPVRAATTANGTFASAFQNGASIDDITLATGDRILLKNQTTGSENGIYVVNATGAPTRAIDADTTAEVQSAMVVPVEEGTTNADTLWMLTTNAPITLGTTALVFAKIPIGAGTTYLPGDGLTESPAGTFNVSTGAGLEIVSDAVRIAAAAAGAGLTGGAGSALAVGAGAGITVNADDVAINTAIVTRKSSVLTIGDGVATQFDITHNWGTRAVKVAVWRNSSPWDEVECDIQRPDTNTVRMIFGAAPAASQYQAIAFG